MKLYADESTSPFAGCLPLIVQAPVVGVVHAVFLHQTIAGHANSLLTEQLVGVPLGASLLGALVGGSATIATWSVIGVLILAIVVVAEVTRRMFRPPIIEGDTASPLTGATAARLAGDLQFTTAVFAMFLPLAAVIYLTTTVLWTLVQRILLRRRYPLAAP